MTPGPARAGHATAFAPLASALALVAIGISPTLAGGCLGPRYVAPGGNDVGSECADPGAPCASIQHAVDVACDNELVSVAEGEYTGDVLIEHPVNVAGSGLIINTHLTGTGNADVVRVFSSGVTFSGITVWRTPGRAGMRIGDAAHPGLRDVLVQNATFRENGIGVVVEATGWPGDAGGWNRLTGVVARDSQADGSPRSGTGILLVGGNGKLQILGGRIHGNGGAGLRIEAAPQPGDNRLIELVGEQVWDNGRSPLADGVAAVEAHGVTDLRIEGNDMYGHTGPGGADDGRAVVLDGVASAGFFCNRVHDNDGGLVLAGATTSVAVLHDLFTDNTGTAITIEAGSGAASAVNEVLFERNATALRNLAPASVDARRCWWAAADGPGGDFPGAGQAVRGPALVDDFIARAEAPLLVRRPSNSGWAHPVAACYDALQPAIDAAPAGSLVLVGEGTYFEHVSLTKPLELQGIPGGAGCSPSAVDGAQSAGTVRPALRLAGVSGARVRDLTLQNAAHGVGCGDPAGDQVGLDLQDVSASTFHGLCLRGDGVTEVRVHGDSDGNLFEDLDVDGLTQPFDGQPCEHRAREAVLIDGGAACEGGTGATADANRVIRLRARNVARGVRVRLASATEIAAPDVQASPSAAWDGGASALGVSIEVADGTIVRDGAIGNAAMTEGVRIAGRTAADCFPAPSDSSGTVVEGNTIAQVNGPGVSLAHAPGDPGFPLSTTVSCNALAGNAVGLLAQQTGAAVHQNDISGNTAGVVNETADVLDAARNWWGSPSGPSGTGPGAGDSITNGVAYDPPLPAPATADADGDGVSACGGDCDDSDPGVRPGAAETCDGIDQDCDGSIDELPAPEGVPTLDATRDMLGTRLDWTQLAQASGYDLDAGSLAALLAAGGDFAAADTACLASHIALTTWTDAATPVPGDGRWYLVRGENCGHAGSFDVTDPGLTRPRDPELAAAPAGCP